MFFCKADFFILSIIHLLRRSVKRGSKLSTYLSCLFRSSFPTNNLTIWNNYISEDFRLADGKLFHGEMPANQSLLHN